jgi:hypothetical protein
MMKPKLRREFQIFEGHGSTISNVVEGHITEATSLSDSLRFNGTFKAGRELKAIFNVETNFLDNMDYLNNWGQG